MYTNVNLLKVCVCVCKMICKNDHFAFTFMQSFDQSRSTVYNASQELHLKVQMVRFRIGIKNVHFHI